MAHKWSHGSYSEARETWRVPMSLATNPRTSQGEATSPGMGVAAALPPWLVVTMPPDPKPRA
jgi:hypothetical protein